MKRLVKGALRPIIMVAVVWAIIVMGAKVADVMLVPVPGAVMIMALGALCLYLAFAVGNDEQQGYKPPPKDAILPRKPPPGPPPKVAPEPLSCDHIIQFKPEVWERLADCRVRGNSHDRRSVR